MCEPECVQLHCWVCITTLHFGGYIIHNLHADGLDLFATLPSAQHFATTVHALRLTFAAVMPGLLDRFSFAACPHDSSIKMDWGPMQRAGLLTFMQQRPVHSTQHMHLQFRVCMLS